MRTAYVVAVVCFTTAYAEAYVIKNESNKIKEYDLEVLECVNKSNTTLDFLYAHAQQSAAGKPSEEFYRFIACLSTKSIDTARREKNIRDLFKRRVHFSEKKGHFKNQLITREDIENVANRCALKGLNDVNYFKCIKSFEQPFISLLFRSDG